MATEDAADGLRVSILDRGDVEAELEPGTAPRHPHDDVTEDLLGQGLPVDGSRDGDAGVRVQMVDVDGADEAMRSGIDGRRGTPLAVQAVIESRHHLILPVHARVHAGQGAQPVQPQCRQPDRGQCGQVTARALDP
jgi:hypothetical protein